MQLKSQSGRNNMNALRNLSKVGGRVVEVKILSHVYDEVVDRVNPQAIYMRFTGDIDLTIRTANDGESIAWMGGLHDFLPVEMEEFGRIVVEDSTYNPVLFKIIGAGITSVFEAVSQEFKEDRKSVV